MAESALAALIVFAIGVNFALQGGDSHMSPAWYPVVAVIGVQLLGVAAIWGSLNAKVKDHDYRIVLLEKAKEDRNKVCSAHGERLAAIEAVLPLEDS